MGIKPSRSARARFATCETLLVLALSLAPGGVFAGEACPASPDQAEATARQAVRAFAAMQGDTFDLLHSTLGAQLGCLSRPPDARQAAMVHEVEALAAFMARDATAAQAELRAMHESDPSLQLPDEVAPAGGPLQLRDAEARALPPSERAPHGLSWRVVVDGREAPDLPTRRPSLVVVLGQDGAPIWTGLLAAGAAIPSLEATTPWVADVPMLVPASTSGDVVVPPPVEPARDGRAARPVLYAAGGSALIAGVFTVLYVPASRRVGAAGDLIVENAAPAQWKGEGFSSKLSTDEVYALRARARAYEVGVQAAGGLALGLGAVGLVIAW